MMKFNHLQPGERFRFQGTIYRKVDPLMASPEDAEGMRMIPRSAMVEVLDGGINAKSAAPIAAPMLEAARVHSAILQLQTELAPDLHAHPPLADRMDQEVKRALLNLGLAPK